jgi:hypothetical protein
MNSMDLNPTDPYSLLRVGEAWRNRPGLATLMITFVVMVLSLVLGTRGGAGVMVMMILLSVLVGFAGFSAAGIQFMDQAGGRPVTPVVAAFIGSPMILLRTVGLVIGLGVAFLAYLAVAGVVLLVCKVPMLGALVYVAALPVLTLLGALVLLGLTVAGLISGAALWEGHSLGTALAQGWAVATQRPMQAFLNLMLLFLVTSLVMMVIAGFVFSGFGIVGGLSAAILGGDMTSGVSGLMGSMMGGGFGNRYGGGDAAGGLVLAGLVGGAVVFAVVQALFTAIFALGLALTYLKITAGLDIAAAKSAMDSALSKTKEKAQQAAAEAKRRAAEAQAAAQLRMDQARGAAQAVRATSASTPALACSACGAKVTIEDVFCGECGHNLK